MHSTHFFAGEQRGRAASAICEERILPPHHVVPGLPESISTITMKALEREKDDRYPSALALRQALIALKRSGGAGPSPASDLGKLMKRLFEKRVGDKAQMLQRIDAGKSIAGLDIHDGEEIPEPPAPAAPPAPSAPPKSNAPQSYDADIPSVIIAPENAGALRAAAALPPEQADTEVLARHPVDPLVAGVPGVPSTKSLAALLIAAIAVLLVLGAAALAFGFRKGSATVAVQPSATGPLPVVASAVVADAPVPPASSVIEVTPVTSATAEIAEDEVVLHIETTPSHALIFVAGNRMGMSPLDLRMPKRSDTITLEIRHAGYQPLKERVVPDVNQRLKLTLVGAGSAAPAAAASAPYHKFQ